MRIDLHNFSPPWTLPLLLLIMLSLQACGTLYATAKNLRGDDVMLLGYDPVGYSTGRRPVRGS